ncbi:Fet3 ferroxidase protein [Fomitopsis serialis]|uniref:Fet3 ferroxidase protein n=1 Tax=Fomitopsis serialis TaxID=139415 RepID=UPI002008585E|nr:Fet3 ferroxidase protein [Neoantrodia serialis]KAH9932264.1 Fet3 ferroxidase protein [Neoantrodia serialis]
MRSVACTLLALLSAASPALAGVKELWWNVTFVDDVNPDGLFPRTAVGVNGTWPPPPIVINSTDSLVLHATNSLHEALTIHHHGMFFNSTSWMDGAMGVSSCGIPPGESFTYVVPINSSGQYGTFWAHAHSNGQYVDGLRTPLIIQPEKQTYTYDEEYTISLGDWYHDSHAVLIEQFINIANPGGAEPVPKAPLMYFSQGEQYLPPKEGSSPSGSTSGTGFNENATMTFEPGKTYRLRIANTGAFGGFYFWIDGHDMQIIEADGVETEPYSISQLNIGVAQRYSVLITAKNDTSANYAIHAAFDTSMFDTVPDDLNPNATSYIIYDTSAPTTDLSVDDFLSTPDIDLVPLQVVAMQPATSTLEVTFEFDTMNDGTNHAVFSGAFNDASFDPVTYNSPLTPAVMSALTLGDNATTSAAYGPLSFVLGHLEVLDIVLRNADTGKHPFHLHGHQVQIINFAEDYTSDDPSLNPPINESQPNPMRRDTILAPPGGAYTFRVVMNNPGVWFFHCHIEWHLESGLAIQLIEAPLQMQERNTMPSVLNDQCAALGLPYTGNAAGFASTTDLDGLPAGPWVQNNGWHAKGIGAMAGCVLSAVLGMATVVWYALGGHISEAEIEYEERLRLEAKAERGRFFGLAKKVKGLRVRPRSD